jgi:hypothetical protein
MTNIQLLTARQLISAPFYGMCFELEDVLAVDCGATMIAPKPHPLYQRSLSHKLTASGTAHRLIRKVTNIYQAVPDSQLPKASDDLNVLIVDGDEWQQTLRDCCGRFPSGGSATTGSLPSSC